jgi:hypothetical protein
MVSRTASAVKVNTAGFPVAAAVFFDGPAGRGERAFKTGAQVSLAIQLNAQKHQDWNNPFVFLHLGMILGG